MKRNSFIIIALTIILTLSFNLKDNVKESINKIQIGDISTKEELEKSTNLHTYTIEGENYA